MADMQHHPDYIPCVVQKADRSVLACTSMLALASGPESWHSGLQIPDGRPVRDVVLLQRGVHAKQFKIVDIKRVHIPNDPNPAFRGLSLTLNTALTVGGCPLATPGTCVLPAAVIYRVRLGSMPRK